MDTTLALTIIGIVLSIIGIVFIAIPKVVNEKTMSDLPCLLYTSPSPRD